MTNLHTDENLLAALKKSAQSKLTSEQLHEQRISFIMGSFNEDSTVTREQVSKVLAEQIGG